MKKKHLKIQTAKTLLHLSVSLQPPKSASTDKQGVQQEEENDTELQHQHSNIKIRGFSAWKSMAGEQVSFVTLKAAPYTIDNGITSKSTALIYPSEIARPIIPAIFHS